VREMEAVEGATAKTIFEGLLDRRDAGEGEAEAVSPAPERAAIQLMTIHAAKGLEFPLVITACCGRAAQQRSRLFSKRITLTDPQNPHHLRRFTLCGIDLPDPTQDMMPSPTFLKALLKEHDRMQTAAEEKRLLYVALTRARDHLLLPVLVGADGIMASRGSHAELLLTAIPDLGKAILANEPEMNLGKTTMRIVYDAPAQHAPSDESEASVETWAADIHAVRFPLPRPTPKVGQMPYPRKTRLSVTEIMTFAKCPRRFYFEKFFPGHAAPGIFGRAMVDNYDESGEERPVMADKAGLVGTVVHRVLEKHEDFVRLWGNASDAPAGLVQAVDKVISSFGHIERASAEDVTDRVLEHLRNLARIGILGKGPGETTPARLPVLREVPFELENSDFIIAGAIDRVAVLPDGTWSLLDFKTTRTAERSPADLVREEAYDVQARFYAWASNRILEGGVSSAGIVFTAGPEATFVPVSMEPQTIEQTVSDTLSRMSGVLDEGIEAFKPARNLKACESCPCPDVGLC
jgi:ATP-dependent exoDNAse (exonuclease V) beta subunit